MSIKKLRIFAGPNGSGKSTLVNAIISNNNESNNFINLGKFINADDIERELKESRRLDFSGYNISTNTLEIQAHFKASTFSTIKLNNPLLFNSFKVSNNVLIISEKEEINSYLAADIADFLRLKLIEE